MKKYTEVKTFHIRLYCDVPDCGGEMIYNNICLTSMPTQHDHFCSKCGACQRTSGTSYPCVEEETEEETVQRLHDEKEQP